MLKQYDQKIKDLRASDVESLSDLNPITTFLKAFLLIFITTLSLQFLTAFDFSNSSADPKDKYWQDEITETIYSRLNYLGTKGEDLDKGKIGFRSGLYQNICKGVLRQLISKENQQTPHSEIGISIITSWPIMFTRWLTELILTLSFIVILSLPYWMLAMVGSYAYLKIFTGKDKKEGSNFLDWVKKPKHTFYSGIYGKLTINKNGENTTQPVPNFACLKKVSNVELETSKLYQYIQSYELENDTIKELVKIILAYKTYPYYVKPERQLNNPKAEVDFNSIEAGSDLEAATLHDLENCLLAWQALSDYFEENPAGDKQESTVSFIDFKKSKTDIFKESPPEVRRFLHAMGHKRANDFVSIDPQLITTAILSVKAANILCYEELESTGETQSAQQMRFSQVSLFPELQARCVLHSESTFFTEYTDEERLLIRHSILFHRRRGDLGYTPMPVKSTPQARVLRDCLELSSYKLEERKDKSKIILFDAITEELFENWKEKYIHEFNKPYNLTNFKDSQDLKKTLKALGVPYGKFTIIPAKSVIRHMFEDYEDQYVKTIRSAFSHYIKTNFHGNSNNLLPGYSNFFPFSSTNDLNFSSNIKEFTSVKNGELLKQKLDLASFVLTRNGWILTSIDDINFDEDGLINYSLYHNSGISFSSNANLVIKSRLVKEFIEDEKYNELYASISKDADINLSTKPITN